MNFGTMCTFEYVPVSDDAIGFDKEPTASRKLLSAGVESFYGNRRGFNATNEFGEKILRCSNGSWEDEQ